MPAPTAWDIMHWWPSVCLYVCMSVCPVPDPKSRTEGLMKLKSGRKEGRGMSDPWPHLEVERSKVKVTRPLKDHRQRIPKNCYKTIFRKINTEEIFFQLTLITNKDYFSRKKLFCENLLSRFMWFISMVVTSLIGANCEYIRSFNARRLFIY